MDDSIIAYGEGLIAGKKLAAEEIIYALEHNFGFPQSVIVSITSVIRHKYLEENDGKP